LKNNWKNEKFKNKLLKESKLKVPVFHNISLKLQLFIAFQNQLSRQFFDTAPIATKVVKSDSKKIVWLRSVWIKKYNFSIESIFFNFPVIANRGTGKSGRFWQVKSGFDSSRLITSTELRKVKISFPPATNNLVNPS